MTIRRHQFPAILASAISMLIVATACGPSGPTNAGGTPQASGSLQSAGEVKFGAVIPLSGIYGATGPATVAGMQAAADRVNREFGGIKVGGKQYALKVMSLDDRSDPQAAAAAATQLIRDEGVKVLFGPLALGAVSAAPIANERKVINISLATSLNPLVGTTKYPYLFGGLPPVTDRVSGAMNAIKKFYPNVKKITFMGPNDATWQALLPVLTTLTSVGGMTLDNQAYPQGTADLSSVATKVKASAPELVMTGFSVQEAVNVVRSLNASGLDKGVPVLSYGSLTLNEIPQADGRPFIIYNANSLAVLTPEIKSSARVQQYIADIQKEAGRSDFTDSQFASALSGYFDIVALFALAMTKADSISDVDKISKAVADIEVDTPSGGKINLDAGHQVHFDFQAVNVEASGKYTVTTVRP